MKRKTTAPSTQHGIALAAEMARHEALRALTRMQARLGMLDTFIPALKAQGLEIVPAEIEEGYAHKAMRVTCGPFCFTAKNGRLVDALLALGFKQIERSDHTTFSTFTLSKGRLRLRICVDLPRTPAGTQP